MKKIKTDSVFVVEQPKRSGTALIFVDNEGPLSPGEHDRLFKLSEVANLFFVFGKVVGKMNPDKFTKIYGGSAWIISGGNLPRTYLMAGEYAATIFKSVGILFVNLREIPEINTTKLTEIFGSVNWPIYTARRLGPDEMYKIYAPDIKKSGFLGTEEDQRKEYSTWTSESPIIYVRPNLITQLKELPEDYIDSFTWDDIRYFLASGIQYLEADHIDSEIMDLDIKNLKENDSEGKK